MVGHDEHDDGGDGGDEEDHRLLDGFRRQVEKGAHANVPGPSRGVAEADEGDEDDEELRNFLDEVDALEEKARDHVGDQEDGQERNPGRQRRRLEPVDDRPERAEDARGDRSRLFLRYLGF